jgi:hypothetical protein
LEEISGEYDRTVSLGFRLARRGAPAIGSLRLDPSLIEPTEMKQ